MHEAFENDVARALDKGDRRMNSLADEITVVKLEQAGFRHLLKENTDATNSIKTDTADMLEVFESWRFDPCSLWAALSRTSQPTTHPAQAGFFMPGETHDA